MSGSRRVKSSTVQRSPFTFFGQGAKLAIPLILPAIPFGLVLGYQITQTSIDQFAAWSSSWIVFAGAAQLAAIELFAEGASAVAIIATVVAINARHIVYSAAVSDRFDGLPTWFRVVGSYVLIDQLFAVVEQLPVAIERDRLIGIWLGAGSTLWLMWQTSVAIGIWAGDVLPAEWSPNFVVPLVFGGLMVLSIRNLAGFVAAAVGGAVAVAGAALPPGIGLISAIICGVMAGALTEHLGDRSNA